MTLNYTMIGRRIKEIRQKKHLSQQTLAELIDRSVPYISNLEGGQKSMSLETLVLIANALNVSVDSILAGNVQNNIGITSRELTDLIDDCNAYECRVILDTAKSLKRSMRDNFLLKK